METVNAYRGDATDQQMKLYEGHNLPLEELLLEKTDLLESANTERSFFLVDLGEIYKKLEAWKRLLPRVEPFYALKCNSNERVVKFLVDIGVGFDCASKMEMEQILNLGVDPQNIVYANTCKQNSYIRFAANKNVDLMTFDDVQELVKIKNVFPNARLLLRIKTSGKFKAVHNFNNKFGCSLKNCGLLMAQAWALKMNLVGVSFHVGSLPEDWACFSSAIADAQVAFKLGTDLGFKMEILDIGGGFPGEDEGNMTFEKVSEVIRIALDRFFPASEGVRIIAEPGRYLVTTAFTLAVNVIAKRVVVKETHTEYHGDIQNGHVDLRSNSHDICVPSDDIQNGHVDLRSNSHDFCVPSDDIPNGHVDLRSNSHDICIPSDDVDSGVYMYYVSDGVYGSFSNVFSDSAVVWPNLLKRVPHAYIIPPPERSSVIWGPTCDGMDCVVPTCRLPELEVGQWLYFRNMGAYTLSLATNFNGIESPLIFFTCSERVWNKVYPRTAKLPCIEDISLLSISCTI